MITLSVNQTAAALGVLEAAWPLDPVGQLPAGLQRLLADGLVTRGGALLLAADPNPPEVTFAELPTEQQAVYHDLTGWECFVNELHLDEHLQGADAANGLDLDAQRAVLVCGLAATLVLHQHARQLPVPPSIRCITATNASGATFRFHQIRPGEQWLDGDLDNYTNEALLVIDWQPPRNVQSLR